MKTLTEYLYFHTKTHRAYVHITPQVEEILRKSGVKEGMVLVSAMHITAGVYVNDIEALCSLKTRPGALLQISPSCRSCCGDELTPCPSHTHTCSL
jgi:hypothetical protein